MTSDAGFPIDSALYAGFSGVKLPDDEYDLGDGLVLRRTYAHVMAPYLAAFSRAEPGKPHPGPLKAVSGGLGFDIEVELYVPGHFKPPDWFDRVNSVWWILALIRLTAAPGALLPVISDKPFHTGLDAKAPQAFLPVEMEHPHLLPEEMTYPMELEASALYWLREHWRPAGELMGSSEEFNVAFQAIDSCIWDNSLSLAMVTLWGGLERLFLRETSELGFRAAALIASFLEVDGPARLSLFRQVKSSTECARRPRTAALRGTLTPTERPTGF